jgi:hypothetical protein
MEDTRQIAKVRLCHSQNQTSKAAIRLKCCGNTFCRPHGGCLVFQRPHIKYGYTARLMLYIPTLYSKSDPRRCLKESPERGGLNISLTLMLVVSYILVIYMFNSSPTGCALYSLFLSWQRYMFYMFRVLLEPIIRSTTAAYSHEFCKVWCVIALEQVQVWDTFTL